MFGRIKTPDQELVQGIREATQRLHDLGVEADRRGITVWLRSKAFGRSEIVKPQTLVFDEAYKLDRKQL